MDARSLDLLLAPAKLARRLKPSAIGRPGAPVEMKDQQQTDRRQFLQHSILGAAGAGLAIASTTHVVVAAQNEEERGSTDGDLTNEVDVLVVGGGTAGTIAAIQAGRAGAKTLLVERNSQLGGTTTTGGVAFPGLFDAWGKQIIAGIGWELVRESVELDGGTLPDFSKVPQRHWQNQVRVNQFLYAILAEEKCEQAGVQIAYYEFPQADHQDRRGLAGRLCRFRHPAACPVQTDHRLHGRRGGGRHAGSATASGRGNPAGFHAVPAGQGRTAPGASGLQALYVHGADSTNSRTVTAANLTGRKAVLAKVRKEKKRLMHLQPETGFRESYRIVGETMITVDDYTSGRLFDDAVCNAFYPVDLHTRSGVKPKPLRARHRADDPAAGPDPEGQPQHHGCRPLGQQ